MKTKQEWIKYLHSARETQDFKEEKDKFFGCINNSSVIDFFLFDCLVALHSKAGDVFTEVLNENDPKTGSGEKIYKKWNAPKSPVRNFLLVRHIDFPL